MSHRYTLPECLGTGKAEPVSLAKLHSRPDSCGAAEVRLPNEMLAKMFLLVTPFISGLLDRSQFFKS